MWDRVSKGLYWDRAWTLVEGCTPVSEGCEHCWAERLTQRFPVEHRCLGGLLDYHTRKWSHEIRCREDWLGLPLRVKKPTVWAIWNDLFHESVPERFVADAFNIMYQAKGHIFLALTKRAARMRKWVGDLPARGNIWFGVSAENQERAEERIPQLVQTRVAHRLVSVEPMLGPVDLRPWLPCVSWVICGPETGPGARLCEDTWVYDLAAQCEAVDVPFFFKGWNRKGTKVIEPGWLRVPEAR